MLTWDEIQKTFHDEWVAMDKWEEDKYGDVLSGDVTYHHPNSKLFYEHLKKFPHKSLAIRYTGNIRGPFFFDIQ